MELYLLNNKKELEDEAHFTEEEFPSWHPRMSLNNRSIVFSNEKTGTRYLNGFYYNESWVTRLIPV